MREKANYFYVKLFSEEVSGALFEHRWQKYFISRDLPKPETAHEKFVAPKILVAKRAGQEIRIELVAYRGTELTLIARSQVLLRLNNVMAVYRKKN